MGSFEILEHTADVGFRAAGESLEEVFEQAARALAGIIGIWAPDDSEMVAISLEAGDAAALLVDWLSEILYLHDARDAFISGVTVERASEQEVRGAVGIAAREGREAEGVQVKAITYHQLRVKRDAGGWTAEVYVDV
jgi:SHS2 domain-containing protein